MDDSDPDIRVAPSGSAALGPALELGELAPVREEPVSPEALAGPPPKHKRRQPVRDEGTSSLAHLYPQIVAQWDPHRNELLPFQVKPGSNRKIWWLCDKGHSWNSTVWVRTKGHGCAACRGMIATPENNLALSRPDLLSTWHKEHNLSLLQLTPEAVLPQSNKKVWWTCPADSGHDYQASPAERFRGRGCPYCAGKQVNKSNSVSGRCPVLASEWDPQNDKSPEDVARGSDYAAQWICRSDPGHRWTAAVSSRPDNGAGCPYCAGKRPTERNRLDLNRPLVAVQWHPIKNGKLTPADVTTGSNKHVWWLCPNDPSHVWNTQVRARALGGDGCRWCAPSRRSRVDIAMACELATVFPQDVDPLVQDRIDLGHNRPHTVDVLIKSLNIVIEYDGSYPHEGEAQENRDRRKTARLRQAGYRVVRVREDPLALLDEDHDVAVARQKHGQDGKAITDTVLRHLNELGWVSPAVTASYLASPLAWATARAAEIHAALSPAERYVPDSAKAAQKRKAEDQRASSTLF